MKSYVMKRHLLLSPFHPLQLVLGLIIWSLWFVMLYSGLSVACAVAPPPVSDGAFTLVNGLLLLLTLITTALLLVFAHRCWRAVPVDTAPADTTPANGTPANKTQEHNQRFVSRVSAGVYLVSALSTLAVGLPVIVLPPCI